MRLDFNSDEVRAVHDLIAHVCRRAPGENKHLETAMVKLRCGNVNRLCCHCEDRVARRRDRICDPCNTYRVKFGVLPPRSLLQRRRDAS